MTWLQDFLGKATWWVEITAFLVIITVISYLLVRKRAPDNLTTVYLLSITVKILLSCAFVIIFIVADRPAADYNAVFFIVGYLIFTAFEVIFLLLKKKA